MAPGAEHWDTWGSQKAEFHVGQRVNCGGGSLRSLSGWMPLVLGVGIPLLARFLAESGLILHTHSRAQGSGELPE